MNITIFIEMIKFIKILLIFITSFVHSNNKGQFQLINVINNIDAEPVNFYNLLITEKNELFIGSSIGVLRWNNNSFDLVNQSTNREIKIESVTRGGYNFKNATIEEVNKTNEYNYLLPQSLNNNLFSVATLGSNLFMIVENKFYHFKKDDYLKTLDGKSVRTISKKYIGTYDGVYNNKLLNELAPTYTNSYIREFGDEVIINFDGIYRENQDGYQYFRSFDGRFVINNIDMGFALDTYKIDDKYFVFTTNGLWLTNFESEVIDIAKFNEVNRSDVSLTPKFIQYLESNKEEPKRILCYINQALTILNVENLEFAKVLDFPKGAIDIKRFDDNTYWIDNQNLNFLDSSNKILPIYPNNFDFHTLYSIDEKYLALSSNVGLFRLNLETKNLTKLFSYECNRLALNVINDTLNIGTIDGLIKYPVKEFIDYAPEVPSSLIEKEYLIILFLLVIIVVLVYNLLNNKNNVIPAELKKNNLADDIRSFIQENLVVSDVNLVKEKFNLSYRQLAKVYHPTGPGKMIEMIRKEEAKKMILNGDSLAYISLKTGYSLSYLRKIKSQSII